MAPGRFGGRRARPLSHRALRGRWDPPVLCRDQAQFDALLTDQLWLNNAHHANHAAALLADRIADTPPVEILRAPQANSIFAPPQARYRALQNWSFFWTWDASKNLVRWMTSFATTKTDVARFADGVQHLTRPIARDEHKGAA